MAQRTTRPPRMGMAAVAGGLVALVVIALIVGPCADDGDPGPPNGSGTSSQPTNDSTTTTLSPEQEVEAAYLAYWDMAVRLAQAPNPDDPEIGHRSSGQARANLIDGLTTLRAANQRTEPGPRYGHEVLSVQIDEAQGSAIVEDCAVDESRLVDSGTGETLTDGLTTTLWSVQLVRDGEAWLIDEFEQLDAWSGAVECR